MPESAPGAATVSAMELRISSRTAWGFAVAITFTYLALLGPFALAEPDEPRYAEIAREMLERNDWVTPHLNYVKYFEKPPLVYWLTALAFRLFGTTEFVARLGPAVFALIGIGMTAIIGRAMYGAWVGLVGAAILAATPFYFGLGQILVLDMPVTAFVTLALGAVWFAYTSGTGTRRRVLVWAAYAATGLAVMTKGPTFAGVIGAAVLAFLAYRRDLSAVRWLVSPIGMLVFSAIVVPWFVLVSQRNPGFFDFFIFDQHLKRYLTPKEHQQQLWFFVPIVAGGFLPWTAFLLLAPAALRTPLRRLVGGRLSAAAGFCVVWAAVVFMVFSLSGSKLATYVLPCFPPLAILAARFFRELIETGQARVLRRGAVGLVAAGAVAVVGSMVAPSVVTRREVDIVVPCAFVGGIVLILGGWMALHCARRHALQRALGVLLAAMLILQLVAITGRRAAAEYRPLGIAIREQAAPDDLVAIYIHYVQGIAFYAQRRAVVVRGGGELTYGSRQGDQSAFFWENDERLVSTWHSGRRMFLVINRHELQPLRAQLQPAPREIAAHGKKVVVVNF